MIIGKLQNQIILLKPIDEADGQGGRFRSYKPVKQVWAEFKRPSARDVIATGTPQGELLREIVIRADSVRPRRGWCIKDVKSKTMFSVQHVWDNDRSSVTLIVKERVV